MIQQIGDNQQLILTLMSLLSESPTPWPINAELGDLGSLVAPRGALFRFLRYDIKLEGEWLQRRVGATVTAEQIARCGGSTTRVRCRCSSELAHRAAEKQIRREDWTSPSAAT